MVDFVTEVQEELRKDDYNKWLKRYGPFVLAGIVLTIGAAGFWEWQKSRADKLAARTSASYISAADKARDGETDLAIREFEAISEKADQGYAGLSLMRIAQLKLDAGDQAGAISLLDQAAQTFEKPRHAQLAQIKAAYILAGNGQYQDVAARVAPLAEKDAPYEFLARELLGFAAKASGDDQRAREQFGYLERIPGVPESIRQRARQNLDLMRVAQDNSDDTPATTDAETIPEISPEEPTGEE